MPTQKTPRIRPISLAAACCLAAAAWSAGCAERPAGSKSGAAAASAEANQPGVAAAKNAAKQKPAGPRGAAEPRGDAHRKRGADDKPPAEVPQPVFRPSDTRPRHDVRALEAVGIRTYESKRLRLHTDIDPQAARELLPCIDAVYDAWVDYFGPLPPNREGTEYQVTGYVMKDQTLFRAAELLPEDLPQFLHGRHRGAEFWLNEQESAYYRRHLLIHEATHCFMTALPDVQAPAWYMEGMAELFGAHRFGPDGRIEFRVMPDAEEGFSGFGRVRMVRADVSAGRLLSLDEIDALVPGDFLENSNYGWSWALCKFLDAHPRYRDRFRALGRLTTGTQFAAKLGESYRADLDDLATEWTLFAANLQFGFDFERAAIDFRAGTPPANDETAVPLEVKSDRGWQSSGVLVEQGREYEVSAAGQVTLAPKPVPWISEPQGVSIFYSEGRPIGQLLGAIRIESPAEAAPVEGARLRARSMLDVLVIGRSARFTAPVTGTLYLRVNDFWRSLADNEGTYSVEIRRAPAEKP